VRLSGVFEKKISDDEKVQETYYSGGCRMLPEMSA
jgi:hypothetical protein